MFSLAPTLRALTFGSPITTAIREAHQMARRHLDRGGAASAKARLAPEGFLVPADIDAAALAAALAKAIQAKLPAGARMPPGRDTGRPDVLQRMPNGQLVVPRTVLVRIGGGNADNGRRFLERLINEMRRGRR